MSKRVWDQNSINQLTGFVENHSSNCVKTATRAVSRESAQLFGRSVSAVAAAKAYYKYRNSTVTNSRTRSTMSLTDAIGFYNFCKANKITIGRS